MALGSRRNDAASLEMRTLNHGYFVLRCTTVLGPRRGPESTGKSLDDGSGFSVAKLLSTGHKLHASIADICPRLSAGNLVTWTPKVCRIMAFMAIIRGLGLLFYILLGFRYRYQRGDDQTPQGLGRTTCRTSLGQAYHGYLGP